MATRPTDRLGAHTIDGECPIAHTLRVLDGRWTLLVVRELLGGTKRFGEIRDGLPGSNAKTLTERLKKLEDEGIVTRRAYAEKPPRVEYTLTERGWSLLPLFEAMAAWGLDDAARQAEVTSP